jgi:hypothetical protein
MGEQPQRLKDLASWPPALTDSHTFKVITSTNSGPARFKRCAVLSIAGSPLPYLSIVVDFQDRDWHASIQDIPETLMHRVAATLRGHEGEPLAELGELVIVEAAPSPS